MITRTFSPFAMARAGLLALAAFALTACETNMNQVGANTRTVDANAPVKVALLVPLNSSQSEMNSLGTSLVNAARMAQNDLSGVQIDLKVYPTGGDPAAAAAAASRAIAEGAQIFVGPLFSTAAASVAPVAAARGLSVLSFSNNTDIAGNNVYLLGITFDSVANRVVRHAVETGRTNIAVIHSNDPAGTAGSDAAKNAIARFGGNLAGTWGYDLSPQGISENAPAIAKAVRAAGANAAVLTDDPGAGLTFLTPVLASGGLSNRNTQFLGLTRWNQPPAAATTLSMQDGIFAAPDPATLGQFEARYVATYGATPHSLAGLAYDGIAAVGAMVQAAQATGSGALSRSQITDPSGFAGVNGAFRFLSNGRNERGLALMQLRDGAAVVIDGAPRSFGGQGS